MQVDILFQRYSPFQNAQRSESSPVLTQTYKQPSLLSYDLRLTPLLSQITSKGKSSNLHSEVFRSSFIMVPPSIHRKRLWLLQRLTRPKRQALNTSCFVVFSTPWELSCIPTKLNWGAPFIVLCYVAGAWTIISIEEYLVESRLNYTILQVRWTEEPLRSTNYFLASTLHAERVARACHSIG